MNPILRKSVEMAVKMVSSQTGRYSDEGKDRIFNTAEMRS